MKEYNKLTERLLAAGYTKDNYPDYVKLPNSNTDLFEVLGGFEYEQGYLDKVVFSTGCGLLVKGAHWYYDYMGYMGIDWRPENDNPVVSCPYRKARCSLRHEYLDCPAGGNISELYQCDCHMVNMEYDESISLDKAYEEQEREIRQKYDEFSTRVNGHVCHRHMRYDERAGEWRQSYDPTDCATWCPNIGDTCTLRGIPVSRKKGNVFYDVKITSVRCDDTLFNGEEKVRIVRGKRFFVRNVSLTICGETVKRCRRLIADKEARRYNKEIMLTGGEVTVFNIRAEQRESRDLMQDLADIKAGVAVVHESDQEKRIAAEKSRRRAEYKQKAIRRLEKKILKDGYGSLADGSPEKIRIDRKLAKERIAELEKERERMLAEEKRQPVQMSIFDLDAMQ